jgi:hypothetical protein
VSMKKQQQLATCRAAAAAASSSRRIERIGRRRGAPSQPLLRGSQASQASRRQWCRGRGALAVHDVREGRSSTPTAYYTMSGEACALSTVGLTKGDRMGQVPAAIFCDMDGSMLSDENTVSPRTQESLLRYRSSGGIIVFSTGRNMDSLLQKCEQSSFWPELCVATVGTTVVRPAAAPPHPALDAKLPLGTTVTFYIDAKQAAKWISLFSESVPDVHFWADLEGEGRSPPDVRV